MYPHNITSLIDDSLIIVEFVNISYDTYCTISHVYKWLHDVFLTGFIGVQMRALRRMHIVARARGRTARRRKKTFLRDLKISFMFRHCADIMGFVFKFFGTNTYAFYVEQVTIQTDSNGTQYNHSEDI